MTNTVELNLARKQLTDALGDDYKLYTSSLKQWFRRRITKEEFDVEARKLLSNDNAHLHNRFLMAIFSKCQNWTSTHANKETVSSTHSVGKDKFKKGKLKKKSRPIRATFEHRFQPVNPLYCVPPVMAKDASEERRVSFCVREATLPDKVMIHGRMFVTAWDCGLDAVDDEAVELVLTSVEKQLKNILLAIFCRRHFYNKSGGNANTAHRSLETPFSRSNSPESPNIKLERSLSPVDTTADQSPSITYEPDDVGLSFVQQYGAGMFSKPILQPVSLYDVYETLQLDHKVIPSHSVYAINMERLAARLWHPSHEELNQDALHQKEEELKHRIASQTTT
ncbi:Transcriptional adapter 1 [Chamberlinius hualienensis]